jgi:hypothetical protein
MNVRGAASAVRPPLPFPPSFPLTAVSQLQMLMKGSWGIGPSLSCHQSLPIHSTLEKQLQGVEWQMCKHKHHCLQHYPDEWQWFWTPYHCTVIEMIEGRQVRSSCSPIARSFIRVFFLKINEKHLQWFCWTVGDTYLATWWGVCKDIIPKSDQQPTEKPQWFVCCAVLVLYGM